MSDKIREAFEKFHAEHLRKMGMDEHDIATERDRLENGDYQWSMTAEAWPYWQAAAALAQQPVAELPDTVAVPRERIKLWIGTVERTANDTLDGRNMAFELRACWPEVRHEREMNATLPYDYARCHGVGNKECDTCLRRLAPGNPNRQSYLVFAEDQKPQDGTCTSRIPQRLNKYAMPI